MAPTAREITLAADMRYHGQAFELLVPWPDAPSLAPLRARFHTTHKQRFSYADEAEAVEIVTLRVIATGRRVERLEALQAELGAASVHIAGLDVRDRAAIEGFVAALPAGWTDVDVLVNNVSA